jgi:transposase
LDGDSLVICEASGGYEQPMAKALNQVGINVHIAHANKVRSFAKAKGYLAKTDKLDAKVIAEYGKIMELAPKEPLTENTEKIRELLKRREQLLDDKMAEQRRIDKVSPSIKKSIQRHIKWLEQEINNIDSELALSIKQDEVNSEFHDLYTSVPAIGELTAHYLIAYLPELGHLSHKKISALVGVAPFNRDSGKHSGKRYICGGRKSLRKILYMAAIASLRWNKDMKAFYKRLTDSGKPTKVAITAIIRKLLCALNSISKRRSIWVENY